MPIGRYYYSETISEFMNQSTNSIIGDLTSSAQHDINSETVQSWEEEINLLHDVLQPYINSGQICFEYNIPRMGKRVDVILVIDGKVLVLEFKTSRQKFSHDAVLQVWDYALDLKNFHEDSHSRVVIPILVAPSEANSHCKLDLIPYSDSVYTPLCVNANRLQECLDLIINTIPNGDPITGNSWVNSGYNPTPTIIEAAVALFNNHKVEDITRHDANLDEATSRIDSIIRDCKINRKKAICFVTGVPGAGKTLIGLQTAITYDKEDDIKSIYLSGNFPLVEVLQESLARDYVRQETESYNTKVQEAKNNGKDISIITKPISKKKARSKVKGFIQMVHHYRDEYMNGMLVKRNKLVKNEKYFQETTEHAYIPVEHIAIFDEAQRAWTKHGLADFMKKKKKINNFPYSEPHYLLSCMDRHDDWCVVICLVGGGQEIHHDEAGIKEWIDVLNTYYKDWNIHISDRLTESEYDGGKALRNIKNKHRLHKESCLHLTSNMRSYRAEKTSMLVHQILDLNPIGAKRTLKQIDNFPIVVTRSLEEGKQWLRNHARGSERIGIMASSRAERLKAININVRYQPDFVHWFLDDDSDARSSNSLEDTLTEFKVQGLEIDWACVVWDADLRLNNSGTEWLHYKLGSSTKTIEGVPTNVCRWNNIKKKEIQDYQTNAYRVLLTRARQGMVIVVPEGDNGVPPDETRKPEWYNGIYEYLHERIGIKDLTEIQNE